MTTPYLQSEPLGLPEGNKWQSVREKKRSMNNGQGLIKTPGSGIDKDTQLRGHFETKRARLEAGGQGLVGQTHHEAVGPPLGAFSHRQSLPRT